jgi:hypothetical protein
MDAMQHEFERFFQYLQTHVEEFSQFTDAPPPEAGALVRVTRSAVLRRRSASRG